MAEKYLWTPVEPASTLAKQLRDAAETNSSDLKKLAIEGSKRLNAQQRQIGNLIHTLLARMKPEDVAILLIRAGIDRSELHSCWGMPEKLALYAEQHKDENPGISKRTLDY